LPRGVGERRRHVSRGLLEREPAGRAALLLVGGEQHAKRMAVRARAANGLEHRDEAALHVIDPGAEGAVALEPERHLGQRPRRPDGVHVPAEQKRRALTGKLRPQVVSVQEGRVRAEVLELDRDPRRHRARARRAGRRLDLDELAQ
jgi:hypothetical protein